jgi:Holliday junction resolvase RusA-like endonuclease
MKIYIPFQFTTLNDYINAERTNKFKASTIKRKETEIARLHFIGKKFQTPLELKFKWFVATLGRDLDNLGFCCKYILDGMVKAKCIQNDNLNHVVKITHEFEKSKKIGVEIEIEQLKNV